MLLKILILVILFVGAVVSIYNPEEKRKHQRPDPHGRHYLLDSYLRAPFDSRASEYHPRLSVAPYRQSEHIEQQERHANYNNPSRDYANNIDDYYGGCPSGFTGQIPYPYDCRRFVNCWKGRAYIQTCGPGTVFNGETLECDNPTKVVCHGLDGVPKKDAEPSGNRLARIQRTDEKDEVSCPPGYTGLLPHPKECSKFLNCASGNMYVQSCGPQTMFNPRMKVCDFAHKVDCSGRDSGSYSSTSETPLPVSGNRGGKTFEIVARENQAVNQEVPQRKGWVHHQHHHHRDYPSPPSGVFTHHNHNCTNPHHNHRPAASPTRAVTPIIYRDRWVNMNRTRPSPPADRPTWQTTKTPTIPDRSWTRTTITSHRPTSWTPIPGTTTTPQPTWSSGNSWTNAVRPQSNYPNTRIYGNTPNRTDTDTITTNIYYAQSVDEDQPSEEVFSNIFGGDVSEISLPSNRRNASRGVYFPSATHSNPPEPSHPSVDAINIPNINLMPPHPSSPSDDRQTPIPEEYPGFASPYPSYIAPQPQRPGEDRWSSPNENHSSMDAINIPSMELMPPHESSPTDDRQFEIPIEYPSYTPLEVPQFIPRPTPSSRDMSKEGIFPHTNLMPPHGETPNWAVFSPPNRTQPRAHEPYPDYSALYPSFSLPEPEPSQSSHPPGSTIPPPPEQQLTPTIYDESNLFGGLLPPLATAPEPPSESEYTPLPSPPVPTLPLRPSYSHTTSTTPSSVVKTNVRVFQIYPPPGIQNATIRVHPDPIYSPVYSGVAHYRNLTRFTPSVKTAVPIPHRATVSPRFSTTTSVPKENIQPEIIFSHDGGVILPHLMSSTTTERHGVSPPNYNREFYKQTTPLSVYRAPAEIDTSDEVGQLPISEAIRLLLRPYFNRSGTVTDDEAEKAESHIMNLSRASSTSTSTTTVAPKIHKDVEIVFAGEQNSLTPSYAHPIHSHFHPPSNYHQHQHHDRNFHRTHPNLPNPFENELGGEDDSEHESTTPRAWEAVTTTTEVVEDMGVGDVCQFDCGNGKCIKAFETCDGINHCGNRRDEEQCDHLGYDIRLSNEGGGRVEVKILGQWGYVCDDKFGIQDANVVCRELGFPLGASEVHGNSFYPPPEGEEVSFVMDEVDCSGNETSLKDCPFMGWGVSDCGPDEVVGVQCKTPVMKCPNDYWLCSTSKECIPPAFVCDNVPDCSDQSDESSAVCNSTVEFRLKGGRGKKEGRLEVLYRGVWGTVCDDDFGQTEAQVACNSLGYYGPAKIVKNAFGPGNGPIWLDQVSCFGNESTIDQCNHWSWGEHNCNHTEDVSLKCTAGAPPRSTNTEVKESFSPTDDVQTPTTDDIGMDLYPMERSSKFANTRKVCGRFNANLTEEIPREFERVVKGNVAKRGRHPWQATIRTKGRGGISSHWCGAVLISKKHLLTAAHCLVGYPKGAYFIRLGDHYANIAESSEIDSYIENWYIHEKFREGTHMNNDIAVIVMKNPVRFNDYIQPICLPREGTAYEEGRQCTISGWGSIQSGVSTPSNNLRVADIPVISDEVCKLPHVYGNSITEGMFCAGFLEEGVDACEGDSGGPFVCSDSDAETLYGIISWGQQCGHANKPGVYVKIEKYLDWIYEKIRFSMQQTN